jgi:hypoxanthine phosphoribosyltransferase
VTLAVVSVRTSPIRQGRTVHSLLTAEELREGVERLAGEVAAHYGERPLTIVGVLNGSIVLLADLIRHLQMPLRIGLLQTRSYRGTATRAGELTINADLFPEVRQRDVLLIDDIYDTGHTLTAVIRQLEELGARSVRSAVLLRKAGRRQAELTPDHVAFEIPDVFVVGYGLDYNDLYRNLPYVAALDAGDLKGGRE